MKNVALNYYSAINKQISKNNIRTKSMVQRILANVLSYETNYPNRLVFVAGLPKSGTTWLENLIGAIPGYRRLVCYDLNNKLFEHQLDPSVLEVIPSRGNFFIKTHVEASFEGVEALKKHGVPTVVMIRDLRDQCVSRFYHVLNEPSHRHHKFYLQNSHAEAFTHCLKVTLEEYYFWIDNWLAVVKKYPESFLLVRYEDMVADPKREFEKVLSHFKIELLDETVSSILEQIYISSRVGKDIKERLRTNKNTFRKGGSGGWKDHFSTENINEFKMKANSQLIKLGYETDDLW